MLHCPGPVRVGGSGKDKASADHANPRLPGQNELVKIQGWGSTRDPRDPQSNGLKPPQPRIALHTFCQGPKEPTYDSFALPGRHHATMYFSVNRQPPEEQLGNGVEMETDTEATATHPTQNVKIFEWPGCSCATGKDGLAATVCGPARGNRRGRSKPLSHRVPQATRHPHPHPRPHPQPNWLDG
ncbi:GM19163 [Drosophila sechellia]|uniref:GM19163 n=1 Tax=Drosophila sechellia TaxID=7238 RepID=B4I9H8_DROSE|nr:GM19163 [Drosophila sechellia]